MAKRRKKTNRSVPAKGRLREMCDSLWSLVVKGDWAHKCAVCGRRGGLNAHHLVPRQFYATRYDLRNGVCLCKPCHQFDPNISPHLNAAGWLLWLESHYPQWFKWYMHTMESGAHKAILTKTTTYFCGTILSLRQYVDESDYDRIVGQRFAARLDKEGETA